MLSCLNRFWYLFTSVPVAVLFLRVTAPSWASECGVEEPSSSSFSSSSVIPPSSSSSFVSSSSSFNFSPAKIQAWFADRNRASTQTLDAEVVLRNAGGTAQDISGWTVRYYIQGTETFDPLALQTAVHYPPELASGVSLRQCGEHEFALDLVVPSSTSLAANASWPQYGGTAQLQLYPKDWNGFVFRKPSPSYLESSTLAENPGMAVFDANDRRVYGAVLAGYSYGPSGAIETVSLSGGEVLLSYAPHISGAVRLTEARKADGERGALYETDWHEYQEMKAAGYDLEDLDE